MFSRFFKFAFAFSLGLFVSLVVLLIRSQWVSDQFAWNGGRYAAGVVSLRSGLLIICHPPYGNGIANPTPLGFSHQRASPGDAERNGRDDIFLYDQEFDDEFNVGLGPWAGLYYRGYTLSGWRKSTHHAILPYWLALGATVPLPAIAGWLSLRRPRRARNQRCANCGYDLRATPERCPECGRPTRQSPTAGAPT